MGHHHSRTDWFFPIKEAPVLVTATQKGVSQDLRVPHKKALIAADTGDIFSSNALSDIASRPPQSPRSRRDRRDRRDRPTLERRAGAWLRDFRVAASLPGFSDASHSDSLANSAVPRQIPSVHLILPLLIDPKHLSTMQLVPLPQGGLSQRPHPAETRQKQPATAPPLPPLPHHERFRAIQITPPGYERLFRSLNSVGLNGFLHKAQNLRQHRAINSQFHCSSHIDFISFAYEPL